MRPLLPPGSLVIARPVGRDVTLRPGEIVLAQRPDRPELEIVKRILSVRADGTYLLAGDNPGASTESVDFGAVTRAHIVAQVTWRYWPLPPRRLNPPRVP